MEDIHVLCKKCGNRAPASSMKLDLDEGKVICPDCIKNKKVHKEIQEEVLHKADNLKKQPQPALQARVDAHKSPSGQVFSPRVKEETSGKVGHKCASCGYNFMINSETRSPKNCPYCNARITSF